MTVADVGVSKPVDSEELVGKKVCEMTVEATTESTPEKATETETPTEGMEVEKPVETENSSKPEESKEEESKDEESKDGEAKDTEMAEADKPAQSNGTTTKAGIAAPKVKGGPAKAVVAPKAVPTPAPEAEVDDDLVGAPLNEKCVFSKYDCSLNITIDDGLVQGVTESTMSLLAGGSRCQVGVQPGQRAYFEVKALDMLASNTEFSRKTGATPNMLRVGFGTASCDLIIGADDDACGFDVEGSVWMGTEKKVAARRFGKSDVIGVMLNTIKGHTNENTISCFKNGVRLCQPQALPEHLRDTILFPIITVKNCSAMVNLGVFPCWSSPKWKQSLIGQCKNLEEKLMSRPADGVYECVVPCGIPNSGLYPYVDALQKKTDNKYVEISTRAFIDWAEKSGHRLSTKRTAMDSSSRHFGIALLDNTNSCLLRMIELAKFRGRHIVMVDAFNSLFNRMRHQKLRDIIAPRFKKIAHICMGDCPEDVEEIRGDIPELEVDQNTITSCRHITEACLPSENDIEKIAAQEAEEEAEKALEEERKAAAAAEKAAAAAEKKAEAEADGEEKDADKEKEEEEKEKEKTKLVQTKTAVLRKQVAKKREQIILFDDYQYVWGAKDADECLKLFNAWLDVRKMETFVNVEISPEFKKNLDEWLNTKLEWRRNQKEYQEKTKKERADYTTSKARIETSNANKKKKYEAAKRMYSNKMRHYEVMKAKKEKDGETYNVPAMVVPEEPEYETVPENPFKEAEDDADVWMVDDIMDVAGGAPLFANFSTEDWQLLNVRYELHLLIFSFLRDLDDERRKGIHVDLIGKYYELYYKRQLVPQQFGQDSMRNVLGMIEDTVKIDEELKSVVSDHETDTPYSIFMKLTEEARREREAAIEAGDESAKLKFAQPTASALRPNRGIHNQAPRRNSAPGNGGGSGGGRSNGNYGRGSGGGGNAWGARLDKRGGQQMHHDHKRMRR